LNRCPRYRRNDVNAGRFAAFLYLVIGKFQPNNWRDSYARVKKSFQAINAPIKSSQLPSVELLVVAAAKDFSILGICLKGAIETSLNPIKRITLVEGSHTQFNLFEVIKIQMLK